MNLPYSAGDDAIERMEGAILSYLRAETDTPERLDDLLERHPDCVMAHVFRGYLAKLAAHPAMQPLLQEQVSTLHGLASNANGREQAHITAFAHWQAGQDEKALHVLEQLLTKYPTDTLSLRICHYLHFYRGDGSGMRDSIARVIDHYPLDHPHYSYVCGMYAFGLEEAGDLEQAESFGREAIAGDAQDIWAAHAVAHVFYTRGEADAGNEWIDALRAGWQAKNNFRFHLDWHQALYAIQAGTPERALTIYDQRLADSIADDFYLDVCNCASLLYRLQQTGINIGNRWTPLLSVCRQHASDQELVFANLHYLIPLLATGAQETAEALRNFDNWAGKTTDQGTVCRQLGSPLAHAMSRTSPAGVDLSGLSCIGGSIAQREIFAPPFAILTTH